MHALTTMQSRAVRSIIRHHTKRSPAFPLCPTYDKSTQTLTAMSDITILQLHDITPTTPLPDTDNAVINRLTKLNTRYDSYTMLLPVQTILFAATGHERTGATVDNTVTLPAPSPSLPPVCINAYRVRDVLRALRCTSAETVKCTVYYRHSPYAPYSLLATCVTISIPAGRALVMCCRPKQTQEKREEE